MFFVDVGPMPLAQVHQNLTRLGTPPACRPHDFVDTFYFAYFASLARTRQLSREWVEIPRSTVDSLVVQSEATHHTCIQSEIPTRRRICCLLNVIIYVPPAVLSTLVRTPSSCDATSGSHQGVARRGSQLRCRI